MKQKIYTIGIKFTYDIYTDNLIFKNKFIETMESIEHKVPILATSKENAIIKYNNRYNFEETMPDEWFYCESKIKNIQKEIVCYSETYFYSINKLKEKMNSEDFLHYCRQELGLQERIKNINN